MRHHLLISLSLCALAAGASGLAAQPQAKPVPKVVKDPPPPDLVGLTRLGELRPGKGFVDDAVTVAGDRLLVLVRDGAGGVALHSLALADATDGPPLSLTTAAPEAVHVTPVGPRLFVEYGAEAPRAGVLVEPTGKVVRAFKPATALAVRTVGGKPAVVAYTHDEHAKGGELHQIQVFDLASGKKLAKKGGKLLLGGDQRDAKLDFRPVYFLDDMTVAVGVRGGIWRKKENQRSPDTWAAYDLVDGKWVRDEPIADPMGLARRQPVLAAHPGEHVFARIAEDLSGVEVWRDGAVSTLELDQPLEIYDPLSVQYAQRGDKLWLSLTVDPTNPPAVKRQKADPRYLDLFEVDGDHATRRARILVAKQGVRWGWAGDVWWLLEKSAGFSRGGVALQLYRLP
jgi:hypothetical protein